MTSIITGGRTLKNADGHVLADGPDGSFVTFTDDRVFKKERGTWRMSSHTELDGAVAEAFETARCEVARHE